MANDHTSDEELAALFRDFGNSVSSRAPLYEDLCHVIANASKPHVRQMLNSAPLPQRRPVLLLAAIHRLVLEHQNSQLAQRYPSVTGTAHERGNNVGNLAADLDEFCGDFHDDITNLVSTSHTQTNDISRSAVLRLALAQQPAANTSTLIDIGCSAGHNLHLDSYHSTFRAESGAWARSVGDGSAPTLMCSVRSETPPDVEIGNFNRRIGFDPHPIDVQTDEASWLLACVWPDQLDRIERLRSAIEWMKEHPVDLRERDALGALDDVETMGHAHITIINSWVLSYLSDEDQRSYRQRLEALGQTRDPTWVYLEQPSTTRALEHSQSLVSDSQRAELTAVTRIDWLSGTARVRHLGTMHPHGYWFHPTVSR